MGAWRVKTITINLSDAQINRIVCVFDSLLLDLYKQDQFDQELDTFYNDLLDQVFQEDTN